MRCDIIEEDRQPNYKTPEASLLWGYKSTSKALDNLLKGEIKGSQRAIWNVREAIRDALFLLGFRGNMTEAFRLLEAESKK